MSGMKISGRKAVVQPLKPTRGGFLRPFGCAWFIREYLSGHGPDGSPVIDPNIGAPQADTFYEYKMALMRATALDKATRQEEKQAKRHKRSVDPDNIDRLYNKYLGRMRYKANGCRYHSFVTYFSNLERLGWVQPTGREEPSSFQRNYSSGQPRRYYRLSQSGYEASDSAWSNPYAALYGSNL